MNVPIDVAGSTIRQSDSTKLLGVTIHEDQCWKEHFFKKWGYLLTLQQAIRNQENFEPNPSKMCYETRSITVDVKT